MDLNENVPNCLEILITVSHLIISYYFYFVIGTIDDDEFTKLLIEHKKKHNWMLVEC